MLHAYEAQALSTAAFFQFANVIVQPFFVANAFFVQTDSLQQAFAAAVVKRICCLPSKHIAYFDKTDVLQQAVEAALWSHAYVAQALVKAALFKQANLI